jgi:FHA domain
METPRSRHPRLSTAVELKQRIEMERRGGPFLELRDGSGVQRLVALDAPGPFTVGRSAQAEVRLEWDDQVSGVHFELRRLAGDWVLIDDGMSRNGTFVNGVRMTTRRRLRDGDRLQAGRTELTFRTPEHRRATTFVATPAGPAPELSAAQRRVLLALCRPFRDGSAFARPATNQEIADALHLTVAAVKTHLRTLFARFGVEDLPQNEKRTRLVERAFERGALSAGELDAG